MNNRIQQIEEAVAYQEHRIQELSDVVAKQWDVIERLKKALIHTQEKLDDVLASAQQEKANGKNLSASEQAARDKPPHY